MILLYTYNMYSIVIFGRFRLAIFFSVKHIWAIQPKLNQDFAPNHRFLFVHQNLFERCHQNRKHPKSWRANSPRTSNIHLLVVVSIGWNGWCNNQFHPLKKLVGNRVLLALIKCMSFSTLKVPWWNWMVYSVRQAWFVFQMCNKYMDNNVPKCMLLGK